MRVLVCGAEENYDISFIRAEDGVIYVPNPCEDLLASAVCMTDLPVCKLIVPQDSGLAQHYLIAHASPDEIDPTYGENEDWFEVTYSKNELSDLLRMFDAN